MWPSAIMQMDGFTSGSKLKSLGPRGEVALRLLERVRTNGSAGESLASNDIICPFPEGGEKGTGQAEGESYIGTLKAKKMIAGKDGRNKAMALLRFKLRRQ